MITAVTAAAPSTSAGIVTSIASVITALALLLTSIGVVVPQLRKLRKAAVATDKKLDVIHTLVNSTLTASIEAELAATRRALTAMTEVVQLRQDAGHEPSPETMAAIDAARVKIEHLEQTVADRLTTAQHLINTDAVAAASA